MSKYFAGYLVQILTAILVALLSHSRSTTPTVTSSIAGDINLTIVYPPLFIAMPFNTQPSSKTLPPYPGPPPQPPSYEQDCLDRLTQIDCMIEAVGEKKQAQIEIAYDASRKDVVDTARQTLKHWNRVLAPIKKRPNESDRDHNRRLKKENMTLESYRRSIAS